jgi:hypothetical protein
MPREIGSNTADLALPLPLGWVAWVAAGWVAGVLAGCVSAVAAKAAGADIWDPRPAARTAVSASAAK